MQAGPAEDDVGARGHPEIARFDRLSPAAPGGAVVVEQLVGRHVGYGIDEPAPHAIRVERREGGIAQTEQRELVAVRSDEQVDTGRRTVCHRGQRMPGQSGARRRPEGGARAASPGQAAGGRAPRWPRPTRMPVPLGGVRGWGGRRPGPRPAAPPFAPPPPPCGPTGRRSARWPGETGPEAAGIPSRAETLKPPADSPKTVTLWGSPPKAAMWSLHPAEGGHLVVNAPVAHQAVGVGQRSVAEEPEGAQPVVDGDDDGVAVAHEAAASVEEDRAAARGEAAAVDPHHDRPALPRRRRGRLGKVRRPDVEGQAVFAVWLRRPGIGGRRDPGHGRRLGCDGAERRSVPDLVPGLGRQGWTPAQLADGCPAIGDAGKRPVIAPPHPAQATLGDLDHAFHAQAPYERSARRVNRSRCTRVRLVREEHANWACNRTATGG